jgi:homoserine O-acetyltransferase
MRVSPETRFLTLPRPFALETGSEVPEVTVAYRTWGRLNAAGDNAVLVCHALTGSADVDEWWPALLGPGRALDPGRDLVICTNVLGSCYGTTGPASPRPGCGRAWGPDFPAITVRDMVRVQRDLLACLGVCRLRLVIGGSLGGMQALEWAATYPDLVGAAAVIAAPGRHPAWGTALGAAQRAAIAADPRFRGGRYPAADPPRDGLAAARMIAMCSYRSPASFGQRFGRDIGDDGRFEVERYLQHHGERLVARFDANTYLTLVAAMDSHDIARGRGDYGDVLRTLPVPVLLVAIDSDVLYPPAELEELAELLSNATLEMLASPHGHDAFLIAGEEVGALVRRFRAALPAADRSAGAGGPARVMKFGGTSVADAARLQRVAALVREACRNGPVAAVVSALAGVTDALVRLADRAAAGAPWREDLEQLAARHRACATALGADAATEDALAAVLADLAATLAAIAAAGAAAAARDAVLACGERLSLALASAALSAAGLDPEPWDTRTLVVTDSTFGQAAVDTDATRTRVAAAWRELRPGATPVATGFIAADRDGRTTTLGRGGSDYTASLLAAALGAGAVEIWTDVDGVLSAPPAAQAGGHTVPCLSYDEATQLARYGGKVLHPATMAPAAAAGIPILVRNTFNPEGPRTLVSGRVAVEGVVAVTAVADTGLVAVIGTSLAPLTLGVQRSLHQAGIPVLATVGTGSPHALAVQVPPADAARAVAVLHDELVARPRNAVAARAAAGRSR